MPGRIEAEDFDAGGEGVAVAFSARRRGTLRHEPRGAQSPCRRWSQRNSGLAYATSRDPEVPDGLVHEHADQAFTLARRML